MFGQPSPLVESVFSLVWRIKVLRKLCFFTWQVLHGRISMKDRLLRKMPLLVGHFCCILCWKAEEDLDHISLAL